MILGSIVVVIFIGFFTSCSFYLASILNLFFGTGPAKDVIDDRNQRRFLTNSFPPNFTRRYRPDGR